MAWLCHYVTCDLDAGMAHLTETGSIPEHIILSHVTHAERPLKWAVVSFNAFLSLKHAHPIHSQCMHCAFICARCRLSLSVVWILCSYDPVEPGGDGVRLEQLAANRWRCTPKAWVLPARGSESERAVFCHNRAFMQNRPLSALLQSPVSLNPHLTFGCWSHFHVFMYLISVTKAAARNLVTGTTFYWERFDLLQCVNSTDREQWTLSVVIFQW